MVRHGENGYLVQTDEELVAAMKELSSDSVLNERMGKIGLTDVLENYTWRQVSDSILGVLEGRNLS